MPALLGIFIDFVSLPTPLLPLLPSAAYVRCTNRERERERGRKKGAETFLKRFQLYGPLISPVSLRLPLLRLSISRIVVSQMLENAFPPAFPPSPPLSLLSHTPKRNVAEKCICHRVCQMQFSGNLSIFFCLICPRSISLSLCFAYLPDIKLISDNIIHLTAKYKLILRYLPTR